jgi:hypothetical protein
MSETMHPSIVQAICKVQMGMEAVKKDSYNQHGGYKFSSTDAVYAELTKRLADGGLVIICLEDEEPRIERVESVDKGGQPKTSQWGRFVFSFVLATVEATWTDKSCRRTLMIQITGPQTFMAAQSYAEKAFLRSLFKLPTGDMDLDSMAQADTIEDQAALAGNGTKRKSSSAAKKDGTPQVFNEIRASIAQASSRGALAQIKQLFAQELSELPERWSQLVDDEFTDRMDTLTARETA